MQEMYFFSRSRRCVIDAIRADGLSMIHAQTFEQVKERYPDAQILSLEDASAALEAMCIDEKAMPVTRQDFINALETLPPNKWRYGENSESFMSPEHFSGRVTAIYVRLGERYYTFRDVCSLSHDDIVRKTIATTQ